MSGHTPGPWSATADGDIQPPSDDGNMGYWIAHVGDCGPNWKANARLIAAAPELLEQCRLFKRALEYQIRASRGAGDDEGAKLKTLTLNLLLEDLAKAGAS